MVGYNYIHYAPPGAQVLITNPLFVRGHDFIGMPGRESQLADNGSVRQRLAVERRGDDWWDRCPGCLTRSPRPSRIS